MILKNETESDSRDILDQLLPYGRLTETILGCCFEVMNELGVGFLEAVYKKALTVVLQQKGFHVRQEIPFEIPFRGEKVGYYIADMLIEDKIIVELKCCQSLLPEHQAQVINYLKASSLSVGLLVNFGKYRLEYKRLHG